jgi:hypothetical protein
MTTENTNVKLTVVLDPVGRTIVGQEVTSSPEGTLQIKNPVILNVVPADNNGKMSVQLFPLFFREFLADKTSDVTVTYDKSRVAPTDIDALDFRLQGQYVQMFNNANTFAAPQAPTTPTNDNGGVVNLFDE